MNLDRRLTPARPDLAAAHLRGRVAAARFVEGRAMRVAEAIVDLRREPQPDSGVETQALFGERVTVYETHEGFAWGQIESDGYVGYLPDAALAPEGAAPTHRVVVPLTFIYPAASMKTPRLAELPMGARLRVAAEEGAFARLAEGGFVWLAHLRPSGAHEPDFVAVAERFLNAPYLWGGKSWRGVDCSGLVQIALAAAGVAAPRDTDMQEKALGGPVAIDAALAGLRRGDLIFWKGHVGIMRDAATLLHANGHHMQVASEPLAAARKRILVTGAGDVTGARRLA
jgi:cell wall-associated NlpC family hydrolase